MGYVSAPGAHALVYMMDDWSGVEGRVGVLDEPGTVEGREEGPRKEGKAGRRNGTGAAFCTHKSTTIAAAPPPPVSSRLRRMPVVGGRGAATPPRVVCAGKERNRPNQSVYAPPSSSTHAVKRRARERIKESHAHKNRYRADSGRKAKRGGEEAGAGCPSLPRPPNTSPWQPQDSKARKVFHGSYRQTTRPEKRDGMYL